MSTQTLRIAEFLTARLDEEEAQARDALAPDFMGEKSFYDAPGAQRDSWGLWLYHVHPDRILAHIAAKRKILGFVNRVQANAGDPPNWDPDDADGLGRVLVLLAEPYRDHPDWRADW